MSSTEEEKRSEREGRLINEFNGLVSGAEVDYGYGDSNVYAAVANTRTESR
jgi:hypothetical protein